MDLKNQIFDSVLQEVEKLDFEQSSLWNKHLKLSNDQPFKLQFSDIQNPSQDATLLKEIQGLSPEVKEQLTKMLEANT